MYKYLLLLSGIAFAQAPVQINRVNSDPTGACNPAANLQLNQTNGKVWGCVASTWAEVGGGGGGGTVTSVALSTNLGTVTGSPVTTTGTLTNTVSAGQVAALFSMCSGVQYLGADGACHNAATGTVTSIATTSPIGGGTITTTGTITCATCTTNASALTANLPVIGGGSNAVAVGTRSGNTTQYVTTTGTQTSGNCVSIDSNGNHIASGNPCGGSTVNLFGTYASLPAAGTQGRTYTCTDCPYWLIDDGAAWDHYIQGFGQATVPSAGSFTQVNFGSCSTSSTYGALDFSCPSGASGWNVHQLEQSVPADPYTYTVLVSPGADDTGDSRCGIYLGDGTKLTLFEMYFFSGSGQFNSSNMTTATSPAGSNWGLRGYVTGSRGIWLQLTDDSTNRHFKFSTDGVKWIELFNQSRTFYLTPTKIGLFVNTNNGTAVSCRYIHVQ